MNKNQQLLLVRHDSFENEKLSSLNRNSEFMASPSPSLTLVAGLLSSSQGAAPHSMHCCCQSIDTHHVL